MWSQQSEIRRPLARNHRQRLTRGAPRRHATQESPAESAGPACGLSFLLGGSAIDASDEAVASGGQVTSCAVAPAAWLYKSCSRGHRGLDGVVVLRSDPAVVLEQLRVLRECGRQHGIAGDAELLVRLGEPGDEPGDRFVGGSWRSATVPKLAFSWNKPMTSSAAVPRPP